MKFRATFVAAFITLSSPANAGPAYCRILERFERSCAGVRAAVSLLGKGRALSIAKACGAAPEEIAQAESCLSQPK